MKNGRFHFGLGITSILMIFVILCLVTFSVLSYVSARADANLTAKVTDNTTGYYKACTAVSEKLAETDEKLEAICSRPGMTENAYRKEAAALPTVYREKISDTQALCVTIEIQYPDSANPWYYKVTGWQTENTAAWNPDNTLSLAGG